ncbi:MAG: phosphotransferase-like protein [Janthinobacterium lividum]
MIILLSGSINAGKTTVSKLLVQMLPRLAHVEVDRLHDFVEWMTLDEAIPLNLQTAVAVTRCFVRFGLSVVISYPLPDEDYDYLLRELQPLGVPMFAVTLSPTLAAALTNRGERELTQWERQRIPYHYRTGIHKPSFGITIDNTHQTPEETARQIVALLEDSKNAAK